MKLGEMLIRDNRISPEQLQAAIAQQAKVGGRLGTVMVEMGLLDLDALTVYLGLELGIPIASGGALDRAKKLAVRLLTPDQATMYRCVPLLVQDRQLIAALEDPHDLETLDELFQITGYRIIPRVAPEIRIYYYIERYYGVARPRRFVVFGDTPRGSVKVNDPDLPAPPLPGLPPIATTKVAAPRPAPPLRTVAKPAPAEKSPQPPPTPTPPAVPPAVPSGEKEDEYEYLEITDDLLIELEADDAPSAEKAAHAEKLAQPGRPAPIDQEIPSYPAIPAEQAVEQIAAATQRLDIATAILSYASGVFEVAMLCIVRDNLAFGWKGFGPGLDNDRIEALLVPLDSPSLFQTAVHSEEQVFSDRLFPATLHKHLFKLLRCPHPAFATVTVVSIGKRVVNLLYGHTAGGDPLGVDAQAELSAVCQAASRAYVRLIALSKRRSEPAEPAAPREPKLVVALERETAKAGPPEEEPSEGDEDEDEGDEDEDDEDEGDEDEDDDDEGDEDEDDDDEGDDDEDDDDEDDDDEGDVDRRFDDESES